MSTYILQHCVCVCVCSVCVCVCVHVYVCVRVDLELDMQLHATRTIGRGLTYPALQHNANEEEIQHVASSLIEMLPPL